MAETQEEKKKATETLVASVTRFGDKIVLPANPRPMTNLEAIEILKLREAYDGEKVQLDEFMPGFIWDAALAFHKAMIEIFGESFQKSERTFFGEIPPSMIQVECGIGKTVSVPWGKFKLPNIKGELQTAHGMHKGQIRFRALATVTHADEEIIKRLFARTRELASQESIYKGQAIQIKFKDPDGDPLPIPEPSFMDLRPHPAIYNDDIQKEIEASILTPIRHSDTVRKLGIPLKRSALLAGTYGTGKSLTANLAARCAQDHGWTFILVHGNELLEALTFAKNYQPAVVFAEDIDRIAGIERNDSVNELLNNMSGIVSYSDEIITILTSNFPERINEAMRRPGRLDLILEIEPPDAVAVQRLLALYGRGKIRHGENLELVGEELAGQIPAVIREVIERAKLSALNRSKGQSAELIAEDLMHTARRLKKEQKLFREPIQDRHYAHDYVENLTDDLTNRIKREVKALTNGMME